jgi:hypothetical protein
MCDEVNSLMGENQVRRQKLHGAGGWENGGTGRQAWGLPDWPAALRHSRRILRRHYRQLMNNRNGQSHR